MSRETLCENLLPWFAVTTKGNLVGVGLQFFGKLTKPPKDRNWFETYKGRMIAEVGSFFVIFFKPHLWYKYGHNFGRLQPIGRFGWKHLMTLDEDCIPTTLLPHVTGPPLDHLLLIFFSWKFLTRTSELTDFAGFRYLCREHSAQSMFSRIFRRRNLFTC